MADMGALLEGERGKKLRALAESPQAKALGRDIDPAAAERAVKAGDVQALRALLGDVLRTEQGKALVREISKSLGK